MEHMADAIQRDPKETPLQLRAKVSLEIYTLAELQRQSAECQEGEDDEDNVSFLWADPTAWDCAILPGTNFKPDNIWCFDPAGNPFAVAGACKIDQQKIGYVLILEVLEHGIAQHSAARNVSDKDRERQIRNVFPNIPVGFVYVVMAHTKHLDADPDDVFFAKADGSEEYHVIESRKTSWQNRMNKVRQTLLAMYDSFQNTSQFIGS